MMYAKMKHRDKNCMKEIKKLISSKIHNELDSTLEIDKANILISGILEENQDLKRLLNSCTMNIADCENTRQNIYNSSPRNSPPTIK